MALLSKAKADEAASGAEEITMIYGYESEKVNLMDTLRELQALDRKLNKLARHARKVKKRASRFHDEFAISPVIAEALALLNDNELVWSDDFIRIRLLLAQLLQAAYREASTREVAEQLAEQLIYGGDLIDDIKFH